VVPGPEGHGASRALASCKGRCPPSLCPTLVSSSLSPDPAPAPSRPQFLPGKVVKSFKPGAEGTVKSEDGKVRRRAAPRRARLEG